MAMNQTQRDYFVDRVKEKCKDRISSIRALHATSIQNIADEKYNEFVRALGLEEDMQALYTAEQVQNETGQKVKGVLEGLKSIHPEGLGNGYGHNALYASGSNVYQTYSTFLKECCRATAEKEFLESEAGQELKELEDTQRKAVDTIMMDGSKVEELTLKLNGILNSSGLTLIEASATA